MISVSNKEWRERKLDNNLINKCSQDNNFSQILSKLVVSRKFNNEEIHTINNFKYYLDAKVIILSGLDTSPPDPSPLLIKSTNSIP